MLTADLVHARRRGGELHLVKLDAEARARAASLAARLIALYRGNVGLPRDQLDAAVGVCDVEARDERMKAGLVKLLEDRATWDLVEGLPPEAIRREVFLLATERRRALAPGARFCREEVLHEVGLARGVDGDAIDGALFADLRGAHTLQALEPIEAATLVDLYDRGRAQAVLLRAVRIKVGVVTASPGAARALFRRFKFLGLLHTVAPAEKGYEITIDGPLSLFESVTKYGQKMALVLPLLDGCEAWTLEADIRWGKERTPLVFRLAGHAEGVIDDEPAMPEPIATLARAFADLDNGWKVSPTQTVLDLPGVGLSVPDLVFARGRERVYFEALGFWSRDAVFRRVDLVERGLAQKILFAVSSRLRVSEELLEEGASGALYVYKGTMSPRAVADRLDRLARAPAPLRDPKS